MAKYKVGDVAALFSKPKEPTEAGKKLQSLFEDFHSKKNKSGFQYKKKEMFNQKTKEAENGNIEDNRVSKKNKKRKFSAVTESDSTLNVEDNVNEIDNGQQKKNSNKKFKGNENNVATDFPRKKKKKFGSNPSMESGKNSGVKNKFEAVDKSTKGLEQKSGFIKMSKHKKNKANAGVKFDKANSKKENVNNFLKAFEGDDDNDYSLKEEIKEFIENNSIKGKLGKNKKFDTIRESPKKSFGFVKTAEMKSKRSHNSEDSSENKESPAKKSQIPDFVRKPKIKNKEKKKSVEELSKNANNTLNGDDSLFATEHEDNDNISKNFQRRCDNALNSTPFPRQKNFEKPEPDFIKISNSKVEDKERLDRTVFVGNLPLNVNKKALRSLFSSFGEIEDIRCIGIETDKAKIFSKNPPKSLNANYAADTVPAFVVFKERQSAIDALALSGTFFKDHHITVDIALPRGTKKLYDDKRSIFIGNLPFGIKDESVWNAFSECGRIEGVRIVRDRETGIGKGFGYVIFSNIQSKENALALEEMKIEGRVIRIKAVESNKEKLKSKETSAAQKDTFKSRAIRFKKNNKNPNSRKSVTKLVKKEKTKHNKKKIASILQKSMK